MLNSTWNFSFRDIEYYFSDIQVTLNKTTIFTEEGLFILYLKLFETPSTRRVYDIRRKADVKPTWTWKPSSSLNFYVCLRCNRFCCDVTWSHATTPFIYCPHSHFSEYQCWLSRRYYLLFIFYIFYLIVLTSELHPLCGRYCCTDRFNYVSRL